MVRILDVEAREQELVGSPEGTESTITGSVGVGQITAIVVDVGLHILLTGLSREWRDASKISIGTGDLAVTNGLTEKTFDKVGVRG